MRDIKFPEPKRPSPKQSKLEERVRPFAADQNRSGLDLSGAPAMPKRKMFKAPFMAALLVAVIGLGIFAYLSLSSASSLMRLRAVLNRPSVDTGSSISKIISLLQSGGGAVSGLRDLSLSGGKLLKMADSLRSALPGFLSGEGSDLLPLLESARVELDRFKSALDNLVTNDPSLKDKLPFVSSYAALDTEIARGKAFIDAMIPWLENKEEHHVIVFFSNTSELRPGGGFMGSFADLVMKNGRIRSIVVHDINDVDNTREEKVVPPRPLQAITGRWRTADANWFFDYPTSARKTLEFMQQSSLYATTTLDGVISVTPTAVKDMLTVTGPLTMEDGVVVSADNFLDLIQKEVQDRQASGAPAPKAILGELVPVLTSKLSELDANDQGKIASAVKRWIEQKDLMIYMRDKALGTSISAYKADGSLYPLPPNFSGDYLAVVDANIGGGKTDRFIKQKVKLESHLDIDGTLHDTVTVTRKHDAAEDTDWWYALTNWNYLSIFTPDNVEVEAVSGGGHRDINPRANYKDGYVKDIDVANMEKTLVMTEDRNLQVFKQSGRNVFGTWQKLHPGESKPFSISYARSLPNPPADGEELFFVFESQSGAQSSLELKIFAPVGFKWKESDDVVYEYENSDPPGRMVVQLTLKEI
jgi:hypothetical protein